MLCIYRCGYIRPGGDPRFQISGGAVSVHEEGPSDAYLWQRSVRCVSFWRKSPFIAIFWFVSSKSLQDAFATRPRGPPHGIACHADDVTFEASAKNVLFAAVIIFTKISLSMRRGALCRGTHAAVARAAIGKLSQFLRQSLIPRGPSIGLPLFGHDIMQSWRGSMLSSSCQFLNNDRSSTLHSPKIRCRSSTK